MVGKGKGFGNEGRLSLFECFQMIKLFTESFVFIDELKFYESLYAKDLSRFKPRKVFYDLPNQFRMDSQVNAKEGSKLKSRKRLFSRESFLSEYHACVSSVYDQFTKALHQISGFSESAIDDRGSFDGANNLVAREAVRNAPSISNSVKDSSCLDVCHLDERTEKAILDEPTLYINSTVEILSLEDNKSLRRYIIPPECSFLRGDIGMTRHFLYRGMEYDFIVADPPWPNKSVKRKKSYTCLGIDDVLASLPIPSLLKKGGLLCIWLSNKRSVHQKTEGFLKDWGLVKVAMWHWLKISAMNKPIVEFGRPEHKVPFESMIFACWPKDLSHFISKIRNNFCIIGVPNANPSRKPPIAKIMEVADIFVGSSALELFARYLLPHTTSVGLEVVKFQDEYFYELNE